MSYNNNIPLANDFLSVSQPQIRTNFSEIDTIAQINHFSMTSADKGKHKLVAMPLEQGSTPATAVDEMTIFTRNEANSSQPELVVARENNRGVFALTRYCPTAGGSFLTTNGAVNSSIRTEFPRLNVNGTVTVTVGGVYQIGFSSALSSNEYVVNVWSKRIANGVLVNIGPNISSLTVNGFNINYLPIDTNIVYFQVVGGWY
jgi:hypothetical protein